MLAKTVQRYGKSWDECLPYVLFAYRICPQESTKQSPFYLLYGRQVKLPSEAALESDKFSIIDLEDYCSEVKERMSTAWELAQ